MDNPAPAAESLNIEQLLHLHTLTKDVAKVCLKQLRGYLDTFLKQAGCRTTVLHDWRDVNFGGHSPEPADEQLAELKRVMKKEKLVVIGNGMAGCRAVQEVLKRDPGRYDITIFGAEPRVNYDRIMLSPVLAGEKTFADIVINVTAGGPGGATDTVSSFIYRVYRDRSNVGYGTALAMFYLVMIIVLLTVLLRLSSRWTQKIT